MSLLGNMEAMRAKRSRMGRPTSGMANGHGGCNSNYRGARLPEMRVTTLANGADVVVGSLSHLQHMSEQERAAWNCRHSA